MFFEAGTVTVDWGLERAREYIRLDVRGSLISVKQTELLFLVVFRFFGFLVDPILPEIC